MGQFLVWQDMVNTQKGYDDMLIFKKAKPPELPEVLVLLVPYAFLAASAMAVFGCVPALADRLKNPHTPPEVLKQDLKNASVRTAIAENPHTPPKILGLLSRDKDISVLEAVAKNPHSPVEVRMKIRWDIK